MEGKKRKSIRSSADGCSIKKKMEVRLIFVMLQLTEQIIPGKINGNY